jgi:hypothetical protein
MLKYRVASRLSALVTTGLLFASFSSAVALQPARLEATASAVRGVFGREEKTQEPARATGQGAAGRETAAKTVQIFLNADADVLIEDSAGKRIGFDSKAGKSFNEIPEARAVAVEGSAAYVLPFDRTGKPYRVTVSGRSTSEADADLSMTGPGFVVGFRGLPLKSGRVQTLSVAADGSRLSFTADRDGPPPRLFLTLQAGAGKPSYRFEVVSSPLEAGRTITVNLDAAKGRLYFKTDGIKKDNFAVKMRRTNPDGTRDVYARRDVSFGKANSYAMDFGQWDGKAGVCFHEGCDGCESKQCTRLTNESGIR